MKNFVREATKLTSMGLKVQIPNFIAVLLKRMLQIPHPSNYA